MCLKKAAISLCWRFYFLSVIIFVIFLLWYCYYLDRVVLKQSLVLKISLVIRFCHWNLTGLAAHDFLKVSLVETFINTHSFDISYLSKTFLDSTVTQHDENIMINSYALLRADHFTNSKCAEVCFYVKESLP